MNTAVEESALADREGWSGLLAQDRLLRDHLTAEDALVVCVGGNDIALRPSLGVIFNLGALTFLTPRGLIDNGYAPNLRYFTHTFCNRIKSFVEKLCEAQKPRVVLLCWLYFLDETPGGSWCDGVLHTLGYDSDPGKVQEIIRHTFEEGVRKIQIPGTTTLHLPFYEVMDGKNTDDYVQRVEPSVQGGEKMAAAILKELNYLRPGYQPQGLAPRPAAGKFAGAKVT